jgi:hypothetical protein
MMDCGSALINLGLRRGMFGAQPAFPKSMISFINGWHPVEKLPG